MPGDGASRTRTGDLLGAIHAQAVVSGVSRPANRAAPPVAPLDPAGWPAQNTGLFPLRSPHRFVRELVAIASKAKGDSTSVDLCDRLRLVRCT